MDNGKLAMRDSYYTAIPYVVYCRCDNAVQAPDRTGIGLWCSYS